MQLANVYLGGSLYQDIYTQLDDVLGHLHTTTVKEGHHRIDIGKDSFLYNIFQKESIIVNSIHHHAIKELADGFKIIARSKDGIIEAIEHKDHKLVGLQFHPEEMIDLDQGFIEIYKYGLKIKD